MHQHSYLSHAVDVLHAVKRSLSDPMNYLQNWGKGDACTSNWTGISCSDAPGKDGYFHLLEVYVLSKCYRSFSIVILFAASKCKFLLILGKSYLFFFFFMQRTDE